MKKIEAVIPAPQLDAMIDALRKRSLEDVVVSEVLESSPTRTGLYRGVRYVVDYVAEIKIETVVSDQLVVPTADCLAEALQRMPSADVAIFVTPVETVVEIGGCEPGGRDTHVRKHPSWPADFYEAGSGV